MVKPGFIQFKDTNRSHVAKISISPSSGMIGFSDGARRRYHLDEFGFAVLYYNPETRSIGVQLTSDESVEGAKKIRLRPTGADIAARSFLDFFQIELKTTMTFHIEKDDESELLIINLDEGRERKSKKLRDDRD